MEICDINFPIFGIDSDNIYMQDGIVFADGEIVDDTNTKGDTLASRRMHTPLQNDLYDLNKMISDVAGLIKNKSRWYIDWKGKIFNYQKKKNHRLIYHKISYFEQLKTYSLLHLHNIPFPIEVKRPARPEFQYAGILYKNGFPWFLYEYCTYKKRQTVRKV